MISNQSLAYYEIYKDIDWYLQKNYAQNIEHTVRHR
jgi:hypothetical protein